MVSRGGMGPAGQKGTVSAQISAVSFQQKKKLYPLSKEPLAKLSKDPSCHSEQSEESRIFRRLRSFTSFRTTEINSFARGSKVFSYPPRWGERAKRKELLANIIGESEAK
jgi:hypothetical protein